MDPFVSSWTNPTPCLVFRCSVFRLIQIRTPSLIIRLSFPTCSRLEAKGCTHWLNLYDCYQPRCSKHHCCRQHLFLARFFFSLFRFSLCACFFQILHKSLIFYACMLYRCTFVWLKRIYCIKVSYRHGIKRRSKTLKSTSFVVVWKRKKTYSLHVILFCIFFHIGYRCWLFKITLLNL